MTAGLREAMADVRRMVAVLAARVRDAHAAKVWLPLGFTSWETYCETEFDISRTQAYRLLDVCRVRTLRFSVSAVGRVRDGGHGPRGIAPGPRCVW